MTEIITIQQAVMEEDEKYARGVRRSMSEKKILMVNVIGSPGCGKTTLLEQTASKPGEGNSPGFTFAVIEGDLETSRDAERLAAAKIEAIQINTKGGCHLQAHVIEQGLFSLESRLGLDSLDVLFIENVGNLVCPAEFDLGEDFKVAVSSVPEGADKPLKYPMLFHQAKAVLLTKVDLLPHVEFDKELFLKDVKSLNPQSPVIELDLTSGAGIEDWISFLYARLEEKRAHAG
ncbi:MAG: hydrogenase nickel incorporation protein HypB [Synergistaceae bacterium]|nr:hydrogenase nickel incorporation protein HypB [Synergistaceae bacterium]